MEEIILNKIEKKDTRLIYDFSVSTGLKKYFSGKQFIIEYSENIESVPNSIASIPFVCNMLPIVWLNNATLKIPELDKDFFEAIPEFKNGYIQMFPESNFAGEIITTPVNNCCNSLTKKSAALFSGGLDAVNTLVDHIDENPHLIAIWGADIEYDNIDGWEIVCNGLNSSAKTFGLPLTVIRSTFRDIDYHEKFLNNDFSTQLKDGWWHGLKHAIALLGHTAPYIYLKGITTLYIASSYSPEDEPVRCASNPITDNLMRFNGCKVIHDGYELNRQNKITNVVQYHNKTKKNFNLHVCWENQSGNNCCHCEKCYRTMAGIIAEGEDPVDYGFLEAYTKLPYMHEYIIENRSSSDEFKKFWSHIQKRLIDNKKTVMTTPYWQYIKWLEPIDFNKTQKLKMPLMFRIRRYLSSFKFYNKLHNLKTLIVKNQI